MTDRARDIDLELGYKVNLFFLMESDMLAYCIDLRRKESDKGSRKKVFFSGQALTPSPPLCGRATKKGACLR